MNLHDIPQAGPPRLAAWDEAGVFTQEMLREAAERLGRNAAWTMDRIVDRLGPFPPLDRERRRREASHVAQRLLWQHMMFERVRIRPADLVAAGIVIREDELWLLRSEYDWHRLVQMGFPAQEGVALTFRGYPLHVIR